MSPEIVALIIALMAHFGGSMYWAGRVSKTLESHGSRLDKLELEDRRE